MKYHKKTIADMHNLASVYNGKCLSNTYTNIVSPLQWECSEGHVFAKPPHDISSSDSWCKQCYYHKSRINITIVMERAAQRGITLLSTMSNASQSVAMKCHNNHYFNATGIQLLHQKNICVECHADSYITIASDITHKKGGTLLTKVRLHHSQKFDIKCSNGHLFSITMSNLRKGHWCKQCMFYNKSFNFMDDLVIKKKDKASITFSKARDMALSKEGVCISPKGTLADNLQWQCKVKHVWKAPLSRISNGHWCPTCSNCKKHTLDDAQVYAKAKEGKCLSTKYVNANSHLIWQCNKGHQWSARFNTIKNRGSWCPDCAGKNISINYFKDYAMRNNGICLSTDYTNKNNKLTFRCNKGHEWQATANMVRHKRTWCVECKSHQREKVCRTIIQKMFNKEFSPLRPDWLRTNKGRRLQLDGYNKELSVAFEHQGQQHYKHVSVFGSASLERRQYLDQIKRDICRQQGVVLVEIPYWIKEKNIKEHIITELFRNAINHATIVGEYADIVNHEIEVSGR